METIISTNGIKKGFPIANGETFWALKGIDLEIGKGKLTVLKGRSGSGKTTLMNILSALDSPTEGEVIFQGTNIALLNEKERSLLRRTKIGFVFQSVALIPMMTAYENVEYALRMAKYPGDWKSRAEECLRMVDLGKRLHHLLLNFAGFDHDGFVVCLGCWQMKLVSGFDVSYFLEHGHQFRKIEKLAEPRSGTIAGSFGSQFNSGGRFTESRRPCVKVGQVISAQGSVLKVALHGVQLCHRIADRRTCCKHDTASSGQLVHVLAFQIHVAGFLCFRRRKASHIAHFCY